MYCICLRKQSIYTGLWYQVAEKCCIIKTQNSNSQQHHGRRNSVICDCWPIITKTALYVVIANDLWQEKNFVSQQLTSCWPIRRITTETTGAFVSLSTPNCVYIQYLCSVYFAVPLAERRVHRQQAMTSKQSRDADEPRQHTTSGTESCPEPLIVGCPCGKGHVDDRPVELWWWSRWYKSI